MSAVPRSGPRLAARSSPGGEGALGGAEATLPGLHVGEPEGAAEDVGEVLGALRTRRWRRRSGGARVEVAVGPLRQPDEGGGGAASEVVVGGAEARRPARRGRWCRPDRRAGAPGRRGTWRPARAVGRARPGRARPCRPSGGPGRASLRSSRGASRRPRVSPLPMWAPTSPMARTGRFANTSVGRASSQAAEGGLLAGLAEGGDGELDELGGAARSAAAKAWRTASGRSPSDSNQSLARRCRSATRSGCSSVEAGTQHVAEQVVVAVPAAAGRRGRRRRGSTAPTSRASPWRRRGR